MRSFRKRFSLRLPGCPPVAAVVTAGVICLGTLWGSGSARADVSVSPLFGDGVVLQQNTPLLIWGEAANGEVVTVRLGRQTAQTTAENGRWTVRMPPLKATLPGRELAMTVTGRNMVRIQHLAVGEVWLCSGQSNMELTLAATENAAQVAQASTDPDLRVFRVERAASPQPLATLSGHWSSASPKNTPAFSAVAYYFGRELRRELKVPVGLVVSAWSNSRAEAWTSLPALQLLNAHLSGFDDKLRPSEGGGAQSAAYDKQVANWQAGGSYEGDLHDGGIAPLAAGWESPDLKTSGWTLLEAPGAWETADGDDADGVRWLRREINLSDAWAGKNLTLSLGAVDDCDQTFWNGEAVGRTGEETPNYWKTPRRYTVPGRLVRAGRNVIAVRVFDRGGNGGLMGPPESLYVQRETSNGPVMVSLVGMWLARWERRVVLKPAAPRPYEFNAPAALYNGMIAPLTGLPIRGFTWYQGEANASQAWRYNYLLPALIADWRRAWGQNGLPLHDDLSGAGQSDLPFYLVQLAPFLKVTSDVGQNTWAELREAQRQTVAHVPQTALAVITDVGEENNIHPRRKEPVGTRLALNALALTYGRRLEWSGPQLQSIEIRGGALRLKFLHANGLRTRDGGPVQGFVVAGADGTFYPAQARIEREEVWVSSPQVPAPTAARYGWANYPIVNLVNGAGLPASPFRTDDLMLSTQPRTIPLPALLQMASHPAGRRLTSLVSTLGMPVSRPATTLRVGPEAISP